VSDASTVSLRTLLRAEDKSPRMTVRRPSTRRPVTSIEVDIANPGRPAVKERLTFLVDGTTIVRRKGVALFTYGERVGGADVIFGDKGDSLLDPLKRELRPLPMILAVSGLSS
jgi:hypothetical protein